MARHEIDEEAERRRTSETSGRDDASNTAENREPAERERGDDDGGGPNSSLPVRDPTVVEA
jgi:hypothetical protein